MKIVNYDEALGLTLTVRPVRGDLVAAAILFALLAAFLRD